MTLNSVSSREIEELTPTQLTRLLQMLIHLEVNKHDLDGFYYVSQKITTADGGEDGRITVSDTKNSNFVKNKLSLYQCKASNLLPSKINAEFLESDSATRSKILKPVIKDVLDKGGQYVLFMSASASTNKGITQRIEKMIAACKEVGLSYPSSQFVIYDGEKIAEWASDYIPTVTYILECNNKNRPDFFRTWEQWGTDIQLSLSFPFQDVQLATKIQDIITLLKSVNAVRVIGHSGIGKTRFVYEALKKDPSLIDTERNKLNSSVVYYDYAIGQSPDLIKYIYTFKEQTVATIVIDNCPNDIHASLSSITRSNSKIKIITIDYSLDTEEKNLIKITKEEQKETVKLMLSTLYPAFTITDIEKLASLAEGYPRMVELLQEAVSKNGISSLTTVLPKNFVTKLVFGHDPINNAEFDVIKSCSIFSEFYFIDEENEDIINNQDKLNEYKAHRDFIASTVCNPPISPHNFYKTCRDFKINRNIMERRGYKYSVIPTPLAAHLAAEWLLSYPPDQFQQFSLDLLNVGLINSFCERLRSLDQIERAQTLVANLWGPQGPFVTAEVLNTELGSRLFRSVVDVNPEATADALTYVYKDLALYELKEIKKGRRNLIWALEKLVFRKEVFEQSAIILAGFAAAENENIANNATNQFLQLFHIYLSGTESNYEQRLPIIDYCLQRQEPEYKNLAIHALGRALKNSHFYRTGGAEEQGLSTRLVDYMPATWSEIYKYWAACCQMLIDCYEKYPTLSDLIKSVITPNIRGIFGQNQGKIIFDIVKKIIDSDKNLWSAAIRALKSTLQFEALDDSNLDLVNQLLDALIPNDWSNEFKYIVSVPDWDYREPDYRKSQNISEEKIRELLKRFKNSGEQLNDFLPQLMTGEQRRGTILGRILAENDNNSLELGKEIISILGSIEKEKQAADILAGFFSRIGDDTRQELFKQILANKSVRRHLFFLLRFGKPRAEEINQLFKIINDEDIGIHYFENLTWIIGDEGLSIDQIKIILKKVGSYGLSGKWTSLMIYDHITHFDDNLWLVFKKDIRKLLLESNFFTDFDIPKSIDYHRYSHLVKRFLTPERDLIFAKKITNYLYVAIESERFHSHDYETQEIVQVLIDNYFQTTWNILSPALLANGLEYLNLKSLLGSKNGSLSHSGILVNPQTSDLIIEWCKNNTPKGPKRIAYMMPIYNPKPEGSLWHPFALKMIENFHSIPGFYDELSANLGTFGWIGSTVPYFRKLLDMMTELSENKSMEIRNWAKKGQKYYRKQIKIETLRDEMD